MRTLDPGEVLLNSELVISKDHESPYAPGQTFVLPRERIMWTLARRDPVVFPLDTQLLVVSCTEDQGSMWLVVLPEGSTRLWMLHAGKLRPGETVP